jgi:uncharacterized integral membrane protein (TIGR00698 family)
MDMNQMKEKSGNAPLTQVFRLFPGIFVTMLIALASMALSSVTPKGVISAGVYALLVGMLLHPLANRFPVLRNGITFTGKKLLRFAIIGMGVTLSVSQVVQIGAFSLLVMLFTLATAFGGGYLLGRLLGLPWRQSSLISAGTGICGGSAIAAIAPVINADSQDIAYALSATFIFDVAMVVLFPLMGRAFGMSDLGFGLWTGTAVNDTSSVVAAGYAFSEAAGNFAIVVKLTRTLAIVPVVLIFSLIQMRASARDAGSHAGANFSFRAVFPWFVLLFLAVVVLNSFGLFSREVAGGISGTGKFLMVMALGAIGLKTDAIHLIRSGFKPMLHGFLISAAVVVVSYLVQMSLGQL